MEQVDSYRVQALVGELVQLYEYIDPDGLGHADADVRGEYAMLAGAKAQQVSERLVDT